MADIISQLKAAIADGTMTYETWKHLGQETRRLVERPNWTKQLVGLEGKRVEVVTTYDEKRRFWVGRSTGWTPIHLEIKTRHSDGGMGADREYKSVKVVDHGPR